MEEEVGAHIYVLADLQTIEIKRDLEKASFMAVGGYKFSLLCVNVERKRLGHGARR